MDRLIDMLTTFLTTLAVHLAPMLMDVIALAVTVLVGHLVVVARRRFGIDIEARHREALHSAIMTGMKSAIAAGFPKERAMTAAVDYARLSVPDAVKALRPRAEVMLDIAHAKYDDVTAFRMPGPSDGGAFTAS